MLVCIINKIFYFYIIKVNSADDYLRVFEKIDRAFGAEVASNLHCHFSKIEYTSSGEKKHLAFEDTVFGPDYEPFVEAIVKERLSPTVICESAGTQSTDALTMKTLYESMLRKGKSYVKT